MSSERFQQCYALLRTRLEYLPGTPTSSGRVAASAGAGPVGSDRGQCPECRGCGRVNRQARPCPQCERGLVGEHGCATCARCTGRGTVPYDRYLQAPVGDGAGAGGRLSREEELERRKRDLARVDAIIRGESPPADREDVLVGAIERGAGWLERQGSYRELDRALLVLRVRWPSGYARVACWVIAGHEGEDAARGRDSVVGPSLRRELDRAVAALEPLMPAPMRVPVWALAACSIGKGRWANGYAQARRDAVIRAGRAAGASWSELAREHGLSKRAVRDLCGGPSGSGSVAA